MEDHEDTRTTLQRLLTRKGHAVMTAGSCEEAAATGASASFDLVISDVGLPDGTGLDVIRQITAVQPGIKGIALSGFGMEEDIAASLQAGFACHLTKPVDFQHLEETIQRLLGRAPVIEA